HPRRLPADVGAVAPGEPDLLAGRRPGGAQAAADGPDAPGPAHPVPPGRAEEVLHRDGTAAGNRDGSATGQRGDEKLMGERVALRVWRGDAGQGQLTDYQVEANEGEVLLDVLHRLQATQAGDLAVRWNCKAGKCGSCSMEINGRPRLACMTRMSL